VLGKRGYNITHHQPFTNTEITKELYITPALDNTKDYNKKLDKTCRQNSSQQIKEDNKKYKAKEEGTRNTIEETGVGQQEAQLHNGYMMMMVVMIMMITIMKMILVIMTNKMPNLNSKVHVI
jgi:hypothetical protein